MEEREEQEGERRQQRRMLRHDLDRDLDALHAVRLERHAVAVSTDEWESSRAWSDGEEERRREGSQRASARATRVRGGGESVCRSGAGRACVQELCGRRRREDEGGGEERGGRRRESATAGSTRCVREARRRREERGTRTSTGSAGRCVCAGVCVYPERLGS